MNANSWSPRSVRTGRENDAHPKEESLSKSTFPPLEGLRVVVALSGGNWKLPEMIPRQPHQPRPYGGLSWDGQALASPRGSQSCLWNSE